MRKKKGQITAFLIIGILMLFGVYIIYLTQRIPSTAQTSQEVTQLPEVEFSSQSITNYIETCMQQVLLSVADNFSLHAGTLYLEENESVVYQNERYRVLCKNYPQVPECSHLPLFRQYIEQEIAEYLLSKSASCIPSSYLSINASFDSSSARVSISRKDITLYLHLPILVTQGSHLIKIEDYASHIEHPLGEFYELAISIINQEIEAGFDKDTWMIDNGVYIDIEKHKPYPSIVYALSKDQHRFLFSLEKNDGLTDRTQYGCCLNSADRNLCFKNLDFITCKQNNGSYNPDPSCSCNDHLQLHDDQCVDGNCEDCLATYSYVAQSTTGEPKQHGESWCNYDSVQLSARGYGGLSYVGSRHYLHSCIDGKEYVEECEDYRKEICTQTDGNFTIAVCRKNRWEDCTACTTESCCSSPQRDCQWAPFINSYSGDVISHQTLSNCLPLIPPGLKFWEGEGDDLCNQGVTYATCKGMGCEQGWIDDTLFTCLSLGDCGNYRNINDELTTYGYLVTDLRNTPSQVLYHGEGFNRNPSEIGEQVLHLPLRVNSTILVHSPSPTLISLMPVLLSVGMQYLDYINHLSLATVLNPFSDQKLHVLDYAFCNVWSPPPGGSSCAICMEDGKFCSEYRCRSLGEECRYEEINGNGICFSNGKKGAPPEITFNRGQLTEGYIAESTNLTVSQFVFDGVEITPEIPVYQLFQFGIETNVETRCKLSFLPNLSFANIPPIWFERPTYATTHTIKLRMSQGLQLPDRVYDTLNITTLTELSSHLENLQEYYEQQKSQFQDDFVLYEHYTGLNIELVMDGIATHFIKQVEATLKDFPLAVDLSHIIFSGLENNTYYLFVECIDRSGQENQQPFYIQLNLNTSKEGMPPEIVGQIPNTKIASASNSTDIVLYVNQPAECKYSLRDQEYTSMPYYLSCSHMLSPLFFGSYPCSAHLSLQNTTTTYYVQCQNNPPTEEAYTFRLIPAEELSALEKNSTPYFTLTPPYGIDSPGAMIQDSTILAPSQVDLTLYLDDKRECRYSTEQLPFMYMTDFFTGPFLSRTPTRGSYSYNAHIPFSDETQVFVLCRGNTSTERQMINESYSLALERSTPFDHILLYPEGGIIKQGSSLVIITEKSITEEGTTCGYAQNISDGYQAMQIEGDYQFVAPLDWNPGSYHLFISCNDKYGNVYHNTTQFIIG